MNLSKSKTIKDNEAGSKSGQGDINKSAVYSIEKQQIHQVKQATSPVNRVQAFVSPLRSNRDSSQGIKISPRTLMNNKSKEILYKAYLKDLNLWTEKYSKIISKQDVLKILIKMKYLNSYNPEGRETEANDRYTEFLFNLSKELLSNLKVLLICIESFYEIHK